MARELRAILGQAQPNLPRVWRKLRQRAARSVQLAATLAVYGPSVGYHLIREQQALNAHRRADVKPHLIARLRAMSARKGGALHGALTVVGCSDVTQLAADMVEPHHEKFLEALALMSVAEAEAVYRYFRYFGDFRLASLFRSEALRAELRQQKQTAAFSLSASAAAWELGQPELVLEFAETRRIPAEHRAAVRDLLALAHALRGQSSEAFRLWSEGFEPLDVQFLDFVRGKTVAVVGPARPGSDLSAEIDAFDIVVRTNYHGVLDVRCGSRTHVSYYNGFRVANRRREVASVASNLSWLVMTRGGTEGLRELLPRAPLRAAHRCQPYFFEASPLAIPVILSDLIRFEPAEIKLFCSDFYDSTLSYVASYHPNPVSAASLSHSIRTHDPFSSFRFVQLLVSSGLIKVDPVAARVLSHTSEQYAGHLQKLYGEYFVENKNQRL